MSSSEDQNEVVTQAAAAAAGRYTGGGYETVYDGVVGPWFLPAFAAATGLDRLDYVVLMPSVTSSSTRRTNPRMSQTWSWPPALAGR